MSMSSLSAQLASINASAAGGKNVGSSLSTSKRHEDTVGRGVSHSAKHGHAIQSSNARHKPSVLYADSKAASDVPLTTLRENCVSSLRQLAKLTQNDTFVGPQLLQTLVGVHSLNFERGLATRAENEKMDVIISELLSLLSTAMGESAPTSTTSCFSSSLHVLEYLLRRYDVHARPDTAERLLLATLPHHEQPVFSRVLQLIDLASLPTWAFLRPFAAKGSPPPNRIVMAKRAAKDNALLLHCCDMAKTASIIHETECGGELFQTPRRGVSQVISFAAAVVVEALNIQSVNPVHHGSIAEPTLRCLLPYVLSACGDKKKGGFSLGTICPDYRGFGHVLASCITEKCVLASEAREVLATTLAKGALEAERAFKSLGELQDPEAPKAYEVVGDCLVTVMTVLSQTPKGEESTSLVMIPSRQHAKRSSDIECLGYALPIATFGVLAKLRCLPTALGHLYSDRDLVVAPFLASLIVVALSRLPKEVNKKAPSTSFKLIRDLIEKSLLRPLWKDTELNFTASVVAAVVSSIATLSEEQCAATSIECGKIVLDALRSVHATGCDAGIAHAVTTLCEGNKQSVVRQRITSILGISEDDIKSKAPKVAGADMIEKSSAQLLPPRVALEHADVDIRLNAMDRLMEEPATSDTEGESLEQALLRHFIVEDELNAAVAAGQALVTILESKSFQITQKFAEDCSEALCKWALNENYFLIGDIPNQADKSAKRKKKHKDKKKSKRNESETIKSGSVRVSDERVRALELALEIAGNAVRRTFDANDLSGAKNFDRVQTQLIQGIIAHLDLALCDQKQTGSSQADRVAAQASRALHDAFGIAEEGQTTVKHAKSLLLAKDLLLDGLRMCTTELDRGQDDIDDSSDAALFRRYLFVYLVVITDALDKMDTKLSEALCTRVSDTLSTCLFILRRGSGSSERASFGERETESLACSLGVCSSRVRTIDVGQLLNAVVELASVLSSQAYSEVCAPSIARLCEEFAAIHEVSKLTTLMEGAMRPGVSNTAISRLLSIASNCIACDPKTSPASVVDIIIYVLALFGHTEQKIRKAAVGLLSTMREAIARFRTDAPLDGENIIEDYVSRLASDASNPSSLASSILMDGASVLPGFVGEGILGSKSPTKLRIEVLKRCVLTACSLCASKRAESAKKKRWLSFGQGTGGCRAAALVLNALELSGEAIFPLSGRYEYAGSNILNTLLEERTNSPQYDATPAVLDLVHSIARMMKGVTVVDASSIESEISAMIISTGPSARGTRARSYSVGRSVGVCFIDPYPKGMYDAILKCLSYRGEPDDTYALKKYMCRAVIHEVLGSQSWGDGVFKKMDRGSRRELLSSLLCLRKAEVVDGAGEAFLGLRVDATDVAYFIQKEGTEKQNLASIIFLTDYIHTHAARLRESSGNPQLVSLLFETLASLSSIQRIADDDEETEFARQGVLNVLVSLVQADDAGSGDKRKKKLPRKDLSTYASLLVMLVGGTDTKSNRSRPLAFGRSKLLAFSLLSSLCSEDPSSVVGSLVPAMLAASIVEYSDSNDASRPSTQSYRTSRDAFMSLVPVFFKYASTAGLSLFDLFNPFLSESAKISDERTRIELYAFMVDALVAIPREDLGSRAPVGCFIVAFLASSIRSNGPTITKRKLISPSISVACDILLLPPPITQVASLIQLIGYANGFLLKLSDGQQNNDQRSVSMECNIRDIEKSILINHGTGGRKAAPTPENDSSIMSTALSILSVAANSLSSASVRELVRKGDGVESKLSLRLWQDILILQSTSMDVQGIRQDKAVQKRNAVNSDDEGDGLETHFWEECRRLVDMSLEHMQSLLPAHLFLASVASLIQDSSDAELCSRAIRFVSERAAETDSDSPEASLFLDLLPLLVALFNSSPESGEGANLESNMIVHLSVLVAVEILARSLCIQSKKDFSGSLNGFTAILKHASVLLKVHSAPFERRKKAVSALEGPSCQVMCSAALCISTLVRLLTARAIPLLPELLAPLLSVLSSLNEALLQNSAQLSVVRRSQASVLQVSILRALCAIADSLPQFLGPYLDGLLAPSCLFSPSLRTESVESQLAVKSITTQLASILSRKIPARQLIPALCRSLPKCEGQGDLQALLSTLKESVQQSPKGELPALRNMLLKALTLAYEFRGEADKINIDLLDDANEVLLALVMKLSEAQLRPLYAKLREWRGDLENQMNTREIALKKRAFWSLSALLTSELRSIFLPCLSTVVSDAVEELRFAVAQLGGTTTSKKLGGKKRQRLDKSETVDLEMLQFLKPLLHCLETALHADASEGGRWVRADDSQRYHSLLSPLSKLLESRVPSSFMFISKSMKFTTSENGFHQLIHGDSGEPGTVIGCLTALAAAAGNEQLWKPLNHAVLEACGNESRAEVRKGGVSCLLSLIKALGEEYMVLLPECLPVLSELLEDSDEEISGLAQECVSIGEDLLGESLQESLR